MTAAVEREILRVTDLRTYFPVRSRGLLPRVVGQVKAVDGISLSLNTGETLGLVGESGSGKTTAARSILRLIKPTGGQIELDGTQIANLSQAQLRPIRRKAQMIFQDPYNALNPRHTVGGIISAPFRIQGVEPPGGVKAAVQELMERVGLNPEHYNRYPNEFSGGQRQRIGVARAIALRPKLIVCDEPVSALDVSIQAQILNLLKDLQEEYEIAYLFVAHDLAVVRQISHRVAVMYLGHIVETAPRKTIYSAPLHPYTHSLLSAVPVPDPRIQLTRERIVLQGDVPSPIDPPSGCVFRTRCFQAQPRCASEVPPLVEVAPDHLVACHFPITVDEVAARARAGQIEVPAAEAPVAPVEAPHFVEPGPPHA
ncbi:MAG: oligopeptide/dipeptide ABC transporter ATP-binding protein [Chloroflexota bacterium]